MKCSRNHTTVEKTHYRVLSLLLNMIPFYYGIRLVAIASSKQLIDLNRWLSTHLTSTYKDAFYEECLKFLKMVVVGDQQVSSSPVCYLMNIYFQTCPTFFKVLQSHSGIISSSHLSEEMENLHTTYLHSTTKKLKNGGIDIDSKTLNGFPGDIQSEVDSYYDRLFSGELTTDSFIRICVRLKESSERREYLHKIYRCMRATFKSKMKFFSKRPGRESQVLAVLNGLLIKHHPIINLALEPALLSVLRSLRKPPHSKKFVWGTIALEQFVDRLTEWPIYTVQILGIRHLRDTRPQLVASIEWRIVAAGFQIVW